MRSIRAEDYQDVPRAVAVMPKHYAASSRIAPHSHPRAQLLYATAGLMMATAEEGTWVVPEGHALWIPPRLTHAVAMHGAVAMCSAYLSVEAVRGFPTRARVIEVSALLAASLAALGAEPVLYDEAARGGHLAALVLDEIQRAPETKLTLPLPSDPRLRRVCLGLIEAPATTFDLDAWADRSGLSRRTLTRRFRRETGLTFGQWRARARVVRALALAADGWTPRQVAASVGYRSIQALRERTKGLLPMQTSDVRTLRSISFVDPRGRVESAAERLVWMAPALQVANRASGALVGCSLVSGLLMQSCMLTAGPDGIRELGPTLLSGL